MHKPFSRTTKPKEMNGQFEIQRGNGTISTQCCDKCGRAINGKGYIMIDGWVICGICQWEYEQLNQRKDGKF